MFPTTFFFVSFFISIHYVVQLLRGPRYLVSNWPDFGVIAKRVCRNKRRSSGIVIHTNCGKACESSIVKIKLNTLFLSYWTVDFVQRKIWSACGYILVISIFFVSSSIIYLGTRMCSFKPICPNRRYKLPELRGISAWTPDVCCLWRCRTTLRETNYG